MGSNLRIMDDAFEYLLPTEAKKKKGQFFTPRHVVEMCVRMMNPKRTEYVATDFPKAIIKVEWGLWFAKILCLIVALIFFVFCLLVKMFS